MGNYAAATSPEQVDAKTKKLEKAKTLRGKRILDSGKVGIVGEPNPLTGDAQVTFGRKTIFLHPDTIEQKLAAEPA